MRSLHIGHFSAIGLSLLLTLGGCGSSSSSSSETSEPKLGDQTILADGSIDYIDYKGNTRNAPASAAAAEYHTGMGYGGTLFDSADKKCQNCHNELYDTWKGSMHGRSWSDPIFQSKFQDFLRTHLAKIGEDKTAAGGILYQQAEVGVGSKNMFSGAAQTCIKCHAPGAYYAGDVKVSVSEIADATDINTTEMAALKAANEVNNPAGEIAVIAANAQQNKVYKATFQIGHEANREGINCAFCHSMETPRLMGMSGIDDNTYTLKDALRVGPHGPAKADAGSALSYSVEATDPDMNKFFRLWGPEKYVNYSDTPKAAGDFDVAKAKDGRYTMASKDINGTDGKVHYTGGPFYGPFGVTGISNENESDETNRSAQVNPHFNTEGGFNHFAQHGKGLCLSCHQRSAGAAVPAGEAGAGSFMELCSTWNAVTTGSDNNYEESMTSPKCQKCHMERIDGTVLHQWARPDQLFTDKNKLTPHFYHDDSEGYGDENPVAAKWLNSHAFLGASKTGGDPVAAVKKIKSGFDASLDASVNENTLNVTTTLMNKTAHMFPGAHPMRRVLTRVIVTDDTGTMLTPIAMTGMSTFGDITNTLATLEGKTLHSSQATTVTVEDAGNDALDFPGKVADLDGSTVMSQRFYSDSGVGKVSIPGVDATVGSQVVANGATTGTVFNAAIVDSNASQMFTRIYGHETGQKYTINEESVFVVRPGFDSKMVESDTRLSPNETETYSLSYDVTGKTGISVRYDVYYMQKGANGQFLTGEDGFLDQEASDAKKHLVTKVFSETVSL